MMRKARILAVDDDPLNLAILEELLADEYDLTTVESGLEALEQAPRLQPDLILLDIMMPGIDGYETCRRLRRNDALKYVKIVLVSAKAMVSERLKGYDAGADDYITKPFDHAELLAKVRVFLRLKFVEEMDKMKTDFLTLLAHETRTPLTEIIGPADLILAQEHIGMEDIKKMVSIISDASNRLQSTLERAMMLFSFRSGQVDVTPVALDLSETVQAAVDGRQKKSEEKKTTLKCSFSQPIHTIVDPMLARLVVETLIDDCIDASPENGVIEVVGCVNGDEVNLTIRDRRALVDQDCLDHLFDLFWVRDIDRHSGRIRMDLPLMREIARYFGGELAARAEDDGGISFDLRLPRKSSAEHDKVSRPAA
jgi:CheY-like chemotaxis protein